MGLCQKHNIHLSREQIGLMNLPNSFNSINMYAWMKDYFYLVGDDEPDNDEIHLDPINIVDVYNQYKFDIEEVEHSKA